MSNYLDSYIFSFFLIFNHDFIIYIDFIHIAASNTASYDVTNQITHRIFNTELLYSFAHFVNKNVWTI